VRGSIAATLDALAVIASIALPAGASAQPCGDGEELYRQLHRSVVRVEVVPRGNIFAPPSLGSGVVVGRGLIVTANHVVGAASEAFVFDAAETRSAALVVRRDPAADLALLRLREIGDAPPLALSADDLARPGRCVVALGSVVRSGTGMFCGIVSLVAAREPPGSGMILTDITAPPGFSGGALVDCRTGLAVGIVTFGLLNLAAPVNTAGIVGAVPVSALDGLLIETTAQK
jgi:S1-C subfamily serine protease